VRRRVALAGVLALAASATGCIGVIDRDEFDAMVDSRGGGLSNDLVIDALTRVAARVEAADLELTELTVSPGARVVVMTVRDPVRRDQLDRYVVSGSAIRDVTPVRVGANDDVDAEAFRVSQVPVLVDLEAAGDRALAELDFEGGHVESASVRVVQGAVQVSLSVSSPRAQGFATFEADGSLRAAQRT
jgi:hypothetical protein